MKRKPALITAGIAVSIAVLLGFVAWRYPLLGFFHGRVHTLSFCSRCGMKRSEMRHYVGPIPVRSESEANPTNFSALLSQVQGPCPRHTWIWYHEGTDLYNRGEAGGGRLPEVYGLQVEALQYLIDHDLPLAREVLFFLRGAATAGDDIGRWEVLEAVVWVFDEEHLQTFRQWWQDFQARRQAASGPGNPGID